MNEPSCRSVRTRAVAYSKIWVESSGLLAVAYLASSLTQALKDGSDVARFTSIWTFLILPFVAIFSVMFSLVSRPSPPSVTPRSSTLGSRSRTKRSNSAFSRSRTGELFSLQRMRCSGANDFDDNDLDDLPPAPAMLETNSVSRPVRVLLDSAARAAGGIQPDDPRTWRGDAGRLFPALQFDPEHSLSAGRSTDGTRSASFQGTGGDFDTFSLPQVAAFRRESSTPILGRSPTASSIQHASSSQQPQQQVASSASTVQEAVEYDEALVDLHPTVASLNLDAFEACNPLVWGPRRRAQDEEQVRPISLCLICGALTHVLSFSRRACDENLIDLLLRALPLLDPPLVPPRIFSSCRRTSLCIAPRRLPALTLVPSRSHGLARTDPLARTLARTPSRSLLLALSLSRSQISRRRKRETE